MNTKFPLKNVFQQYDSRGVNATKSVHLFTSQPFESRKSRTTRNIAVFWGRNDRCWKPEKIKKKKKKNGWKLSPKHKDGKNEQMEKRVTKKRFYAFARRWQDICALILHSFSLFPLLLAKAATKRSTTSTCRGKKWNGITILM